MQLWNERTHFPYVFPLAAKIHRVHTPEEGA